jgi:hypothetical protein
MDGKTATEIDNAIVRAAQDIFASTEADLYFQPSNCLDLMTIGELIDRLTIVNLKLFKMKDMQSSSLNGISLALSAKADVNLCKERSNVKNAITEKICDMISKEYNKVSRSDSNEVKTYG